MTTSASSCSSSSLSTSRRSSSPASAQPCSLRALSPPSRSGLLYFRAPFVSKLLCLCAVLTEPLIAIQLLACINTLCALHSGAQHAINCVCCALLQLCQSSFVSWLKLYVKVHLFHEARALYAQQRRNSMFIIHLLFMLWCVCVWCVCARVSDVHAQHTHVVGILIAHMA